MSEEKGTTTEPSADDRLLAFAELVADPEVPAAKIAELANVPVEMVEALRAEPATSKPAEKEVKGPKSPKPDRRTLELAAAAQHLIDDGWRLARGRLVPPSDERPIGRGTKINLKSAFVAKGPLPSGKVGTHRFGASIYRGAMAELVMKRARESGNEGLVEILED